MTRSRILSNLDKQIQTCSEQLRQKKTRKGYDIIKNKDRHSKLKQFIKGNDNTSHRTLNTVTRNGQPNNHDPENGSETSSAKRRIDEKMRDLKKEFETKLHFERTKFERKKLELEMQIKELEM